LQLVLSVSLRVLSIIFLINGAWMVISPITWFNTVPGVVNTGKANGHLVGDVGFVYVLSAAVSLYTLRNPFQKRDLMASMTAWHVLHSLWHIFEISVGRLPIQHLWMDFPGVFLPSIALVMITIWFDYGSNYEPVNVDTHQSTSVHYHQSSCVVQ